MKFSNTINRRKISRYAWLVGAIISSMAFSLAHAQKHPRQNMAQDKAESSMGHQAPEDQIMRNSAAEELGTLAAPNPSMKKKANELLATTAGKKKQNSKTKKKSAPKKSSDEI